jgi:anti-sigma regulatory factor (Ser/Thr protein kinase)
VATPVCGHYQHMENWTGRFPATDDAPVVLRGEMAAIGRRCGLSEGRIEAMKIAVWEAATNAVRHAYRDREQAGDVIGTAQTQDGTLRIVIADDGIGMSPRADSPGLGLGLPLMARLADTLTVASNGPGTQIHMTFARPLGETERLAQS